MSSSNATIGTCPSPCGDSPLTIAGNIISILTFAYALLAGLFYYYSVVVNASDEMSELLRAYIPLYEDGISLRHSTNKEQVKQRGDLDLDSAYTHLVSELTEAKSLIDKIMRQVKYRSSAWDTAGQAGEREKHGSSAWDIAGQAGERERQAVERDAVREKLVDHVRRQYRWSVRFRLLANREELRTASRQLHKRIEHFKRASIPYFPESVSYNVRIAASDANI
jgi:hypothetical protein